MAALISINKPHTDNIFIHKKKKVEWRKHPLPLTTHYCYETKNKGGIGKVIGQFNVVQNVKFDPLNHHWYSSEFIEEGCVPIEDLLEYADGDIIYGNVLEDVQRYDTPRELSDFARACNGENAFGCTECEYFRLLENPYYKCLCNHLKPLTRPPQSWCYIEGGASK